MIVTKGFEDGNILGYDAPYPIKLDLAVVVDNDISHTFDVRPLNLFFCAIAVLFRQAGGQLSDLQNAERDGLLIIAVTHETLR